MLARARFSGGDVSRLQLATRNTLPHNRLPIVFSCGGVGYWYYNSKEYEPPIHSIHSYIVFTLFHIGEGLSASILSPINHHTTVEP